MGGQSVSVELSDEDMIGPKNTPEVWAAKSLVEKHHEMMNAGDILVVDYLRASGQITPEYFRSRIKEIKERYQS